MNRFILFTLSLLVAGRFKYIESARILTVLPIPSNEHQSVYRPLLESLYKNGHQLTILTTDPYFTNCENITEIDLSFVYNLDVLNELKDVDLEGSDMLKTVFNVMRQLFAAQLKSPRVKQLLNDEQEYFDLVLVDWSGSSSLMNIFAYHFNAPLVAITNGDAFPNVHEAFGNPNHPITYPSVFLPFNEDLSLIQRIFSVFSTISYRYVVYFAAIFNHLTFSYSTY
jgi:glucuronosyltransferase